MAVCWKIRAATVLPGRQFFRCAILHETRLPIAPRSATAAAAVIGIAAEQTEAAEMQRAELESIIFALEIAAMKNLIPSK
ncbi:MAG: hypothetical protein U0Y68_08295 [Blastocatellia bacterium]